MKGFVLRNWLMQLRRMNEKSYSLLLSANRSPRRAGGVTESEFEGLRTRSSESRRKSLSQPFWFRPEVGDFSFLCLLALFRPSADWMMLTCIGEGNCFTQFINSVPISSGNFLTDTFRSAVLPAIWTPMAQSS